MDTSEAQVSAIETQSDSSAPSESPPTRSGKPWFWRLLILFLATGGIILWRMLAPGGGQRSSVAQQQQAPAPKAIETIALANGRATRSVQLLGQVEASQQSILRAQTSGIVERIFVQSGDRVRAGMAIAGNLNLPSNSPSFVVSRDALTRRQNQWLVFTVAGGKAKQIPVEMVADMGKDVAIYHSTLRTGQPIVLRGGDGLQDGAPLKIVDPT